MDCNQAQSDPRDTKFRRLQIPPNQATSLGTSYSMRWQSQQVSRFDTKFLSELPYDLQPRISPCGTTSASQLFWANGTDLP